MTHVIQPCLKDSRIGPNRPLPIPLQYQQTLANGEWYYQYKPANGDETTFEIFIDPKKGVWKLQESNAHFAPTVFSNLPLGRPSQIQYTDFLLHRQCEEGDCEMIWLYEETVQVYFDKKTIVKQPLTIQLDFKTPLCRFDQTTNYRKQHNFSEK